VASVKAACNSDPNSSGCKEALAALKQQTSKSIISELGLDKLPKYLVIAGVAYVGLNILMAKATTSLTRGFR
jgi:hypothetical protein